MLEDSSLDDYEPTPDNSDLHGLRENTKNTWCRNFDKAIKAVNEQVATFADASCLIKHDLTINI